MEENHFKTRQERRESKLRKKKEHMRRHGAGLAKVYRNALEKRSQTGEGKEKEAK
jgi:hypothetical protein